MGDPGRRMVCSSGIERSALRWWAPLILLVTLPGCVARTPAAMRPAPQTTAPQRVHATQPEPQEQGQAEAAQRARQCEAIYSDLQLIELDYREGVDLIVGGDEVRGERAQEEALNRLGERIRECDALPECDRSRILDTYRSLLGQQGIALKKQAANMSALRASVEEDTEHEPGTESFEVALPELGRAVTLLRGTELGAVISLNGPVRAALDDWLTWMRPRLMSSYENYQFLRAEIAPVYEEAGLPEALLFAMLAAETGGRVHSVSRAGAAGPLQFMRFTGQRYGLNVVDGFDQRLDPVPAVRANVAYLTEHFELFDDNLEKVLAAYNGGENRMKGLHRRLHGASFWDSNLYYALPAETREYVPRILAAAWLFLHPEDYNLEFPVLDTRTTSLTVEATTSLGELAICLGQAGNPNGWFRTLRNLNPRLEPADRIAAGDALRVPALLLPVYRQQCLGGELLVRARELRDANYPAQPEMIPYTVRQGDTLGKIASRLPCASLGELADLNSIRPPGYVIQVGQEIRLPSCAAR